jgi:proteasome lid subunit RPN8/RPN11
VIDALLAEAARAAPHEACGLLLGRSPIAAIRPTANVAADPAHRFEIDPAELIAAYKAERAGGPALAGFYHSHPSGSALPSPTDRLNAGGDGRIWAIVGSGEVRFWRDCAEGFVALSSVPADG